MKRIVFRTDASVSIGSGHVMRCLALSEVFSRGGWLIGFACSRETFETVKKIANFDADRLHLEEEVVENEALAIGAYWGEIDILVVDHYQRAVEFERACRPFCDRIVVIDDLADRTHDCDVLVDSAARSSENYQGLVPDFCQLFTGPAFAPLATEYRGARRVTLARRSNTSVVQRILVSFGQIDAGNATELALRILAGSGYSGAIDIAIGGASPHILILQQYESEDPKLTLHINSSDMPALMSAADFAIGGGGTMSWERCCLGLASAMIEIAGNQRGVIDLIESRGAGIDLGAKATLNFEQCCETLRALLANPAHLRRTAYAASLLIDGRGSDRILLAAIGGLTAANGVETRLRLAEQTDEDWLLGLHQSPETRKFSHVTRQTSESEHKKWLNSTLSDPDRLLTIVEAAGEPVGMLRLDYIGHAVRVSIAISPSQYKQGYGFAALKLAASLVPGRSLNAEIKPDNKASLALFKQAGYREVAEGLYRLESR